MLVYSTWISFRFGVAFFIDGPCTNSLAKECPAARHDPSERLRVRGVDCCRFYWYQRQSQETGHTKASVHESAECSVVGGAVYGFIRVLRRAPTLAGS